MEQLGAGSGTEASRRARSSPGRTRLPHLGDSADKTGNLQRSGAQFHTRFGREDCVMAMALTKDERLVLRYLASGRSIEEIAATLNWPLQAVRWTCTHRSSHGC